jgi:C-terminal processing protease CtpA/Prc
MDPRRVVPNRLLRGGAVLMAVVLAFPIAVAAAEPPVRPDALSARLAAGDSGSPKAAARGISASRFTPLVGAGGGHGPADTLRWCSRLATGPAGSNSIPVDLSAATITAREFGVTSAYLPSDLSLADALGAKNALTANGIASALADYVTPLGDTCTTSAQGGSLGPASVTAQGDVAIVRPGTGNVSLPKKTTAVVVDLRNLPAAVGVGDAVRRAVATALRTAPTPPLRWLRLHNGPADEVFTPFSTYSTSVEILNAPPLPTAATRDLPLVLLTSERMAPEVAEIAGTLRLTQRAWVVGDDILTQVAESRWRSVGSSGIAARTQVLDRPTGGAVLLDVGGLSVGQDDPNDPTTASLTQTVSVGNGLRRLSVSLDGPNGADIDLYVLHDADGNGTFSFPAELVAAGITASADEVAQVAGLVPAGAYQILIHGYFVPRPPARVSLRVDTTTAELWPDVILADRPDDPSTAVQTAAIAQALAGATPPATGGTATRSTMITVDPFVPIRPDDLGRGEMRSALLVAHGLTRLFFRYFPVVGDGIDARLIETLGAVDAWKPGDRPAARNILRRFGEVLHDGHQFVFNFGDSDSVGFLPIMLDDIGGQPVVRTSAIGSILPGDTLVSIDGRPATDIIAEELARTSAATSGYRFDIATRELNYMTGPQTIQVQAPGGPTRTVVVQPQPVAALFQALDARFPRQNGPLGDLGAADLYYLNVDLPASPTIGSVRAALAQANAIGARGLILDVRGYPTFGHYELAQRLIQQPFSSPIFGRAIYVGSDTMFPVASAFMLQPLANPSWRGPIVLITGPHAVSAAENFMIMLVGAGRLDAIVGAQSAGTNGNITGGLTPGAWGFTYTGMEVLFPDGSQFHGVGIVPDVPVALSATDLRDGIDRDLLTAIEVMRENLHP